MALFDYAALDAKGNKRKGRIDAASLKAAKQSLQGQGLYLTEIRPHQERSLKLSLGAKTGGRISGRQIADFTAQFAVLQATGIPYDKALEILIQETKNPVFLHLLSEVKARIEEGAPFAQALEPHQAQFGKMYLAMVRAGEAGGNLAKVLGKLSKYLEETEEIKGRLSSALVYPIVMTLVGLAIVVFLLTFILPKIVPLFQQFEVELPLATRMVIGASDLISGAWWILLPLGLAGIYAFQRYKATPAGAWQVESALLKTPVLAGMLHKLYHYRFAQTLGALLTGGVEVKEALSIVSQVTGSVVYEKAFAQVDLDITQKGLDLSQALRKTGLFPPALVQMVRVGEEAGELEAMMEQITANLEKEMARTMQKGLALLEPVLIVLMALGVGFIVMAVMLPMFELNQML